MILKAICTGLFLFSIQSSAFDVTTYILLTNQQPRYQQPVNTSRVCENDPALLEGNQQLSSDGCYKLLLSMKYLSENTVTKEVNFYGTEIDPNVIYSGHGQFLVTVDGIEVPDLNDGTYWRLHQLRRPFSYDTLSQGIQKLEPRKAVCKLAGPAMGILLETCYLTYHNDQIIHDEMRPVYDIPLNCLYQRKYQPANEKAREVARGVMETLRTIDEFSLGETGY